MKINRRNFLNLTSLTTTGSLLFSSLLNAQIVKHFANAGLSNQGEGKTILLLSGWQDVNIGDIAHTPGLLNVLQTFLPKAKIILWKRSVATEPVKKLLTGKFPNVDIVYGKVDTEKNVDSREVLAAFQQADILIHGSGPSVTGGRNVEAWVKTTGKPFGIFGVTIQSVSDGLKRLLLKASFIFLRETKSIEVLNKAGISGHHIAFVPDATFFMDIREDQKAKSFLNKNGLEPKKFICAIPRLRHTPYYKFMDWKWSEERIKNVEETNSKYKEQDHAKLREVMVHWVRETGNKVLVCPEMTYEVDIMDELLIDPLPDDVKPYVVKRGYWMPDLAASVYRQAHTVLSFECHSPIMALHNRTPAFYLRQPQDTIKGQMYYDLGYDDWVFEIMETEGREIINELMMVDASYDEAQKRILKSNEKIRKIYQEAVQTV